MARHWGALRSEWDFFIEQGLGSDLLPVVSNPNATVSANSSLKKVNGLGKVPSLYNYRNEVVGIKDWPLVQATEHQLRLWANQPDYGISIIARLIKGIDVDVTDARLSARIRETIDDFLLSKGIIEYPVRFRKDSFKFLIAVEVPNAPLDKGAFSVGDHGIVELLSNKQQFIAIGTNPSGARYEWSDLNLGFPKLTKEELVELWQILRDKYEDKDSLSAKQVGLKEITNRFEVQDDPLYNALVEKAMVKSEGSDQGSFNIVCPFAHEHTTESNDEKDSSTTYFAPHTGGHANASIKCLHAHCAERTTGDFKKALGLDGTEDFESIEGNIIALPTPASFIAKKKMFGSVESIDFSEDYEEVKWLLKGIIPAVSAGTILGPSNCGKTFAAFDLAACFARGIPWYGKRCRKGRVIYVIAEGATMLKLRIKAYRVEHNINTAAELPISVVDAQPNLLNKEDLAAFVQTQREDFKNEEIVAVIFDTYAMCMIGDENSSHDTGVMIRSLQHVSKALSCAAIAVHHTGKNADLGGRGHSSLKCAMDFEIIVKQKDENSPVRTIKSGKIKDGLDKFEHHFKLKRLVLGTDSDGDEISSCVVVNVEPEDIPVETPKLRNGEEMTMAVIYDYQRKGTGQWPDFDVLVDIIRKKEISEKGKDAARKPYHIKRSINSMIDHKRGIVLTKENRVVPMFEEIENDDNAQHEKLSVDNSENRNNVTPFPK